MITTIRKGIKSKTAKAVLLITAAAVGGFFTLPLFLGKNQGGQWVARVNGEDISYNEFVQKTMDYENRIQELRAQYGQMAESLLESMGMPSNPRVFAANQLISETLLDEVIRKLSLNVHSDYITQMLNNQYFVMRELADLVPVQLMNQQGGMNMEALRAYLPRVGMTMADLEKKIGQRIQRSLVINVVSNAHYVSEMELKARYTQEYLGHKYSLLRFDIKTYSDEAKKTPVTQEQIKRFYDGHSRQYMVAERRSGKVWEFDQKSYGSTVEDAEIELFYNENKQRLFVEAPVKLEVRRILLASGDTASSLVTQEKATALRAELVKNPTLFGAKAKELSQDKESADRGGLLPEFSRGKYSAEFEKAAFLLKQDGDISSVIRTKDGYEIIQRVHRKEAVVKPLPSVKGEIIAKLETRKFKDQFHRDMKNYLRDEVMDAAERDRLFGMAKSVKVVEQVERADAKLNKVLFRMQEGSYDFYTDGDRGYVVQLTNIHKAFQPSLDAIRANVEKDFYEQTASTALAQAVVKARKDAKTKSFSELKELYKASLETTDMIKFNDAAATKALRTKNYPVDILQNLDKIGAIAVSQGKTDGVLCQLESIEPFDEKDFIAKKNELAQGLQNETGNLALQAFVAFLHRNAKIEVNKSIVNLEE
jgi:parvulin-like peptidyl-prolyl isomerase